MADIPGDLSTTATLTVGGTATDILETLGDHDWFKITLTAGQAVTVSVDLGTLEDSYLNIRDSSGTILYSNDDIVDGVIRGSKVSFMPTVTGTYYIDVGAFNDQYTGTYTVSVQPYTQPPVATNDQIANQLVSGFWGGDVHHFGVTQGGTITVNISTLNASEQTLARAALQEWTDIIGVHFQEVTSGGQIVFDDSADPSGPIAATDASYSNGITTSAHVHISTSWVKNYGTGLNTYSFQTYIHEIGHALGLGHAGDYNNNATFPYDASFLNDSWATTVMSYFDQHENTYFNSLGFSEDFVVTPMAADILAMQQLYGLSTTTRTGNTVYGFHSNAGGIYDATVYPNVAYTVFDSGGNDTLDFSGSSARQLINLNPETFSNVDGNVGNLSIARGTVIENAIGGNGSDTIIGNSADNVLTGNLGADTLTGGGGNDVFRDSEANHNGDTITDFSAGDSIVFTDATLGSFTYSISGNTLNFTGGSLTLTNVPAGRVVVTAAAGGGVQLSVAPAVHDDFNGDGKSDVLWLSDSGQAGDWLGQPGGSFAGNSNFVAFLPTDWHVVGTGDFNGDSHVDVLLRNDNGTVSEWLGQANGGFAGNASVNIPVPTDWSIAATGDFNGDGMSDVLLRNTNGTVGEWLGQSNGGFAANVTNGNIPLPTDWHIVGTGDFNGDGIDDVLLRSDSGQVGDWLGQSNGGFVGNANFVAFLPSDWNVVGTGDFNGDGMSDVLLRNTNGTVSEWLGQSNGGFAGNGNVNIPLPTDWHVASIGDFNGDGMADVLLRNTNGTVGEWLGQSDGGFVANTSVGFNMPTNWHVQDPFIHDTVV